MATRSTYSAGHRRERTKRAELTLAEQRAEPGLACGRVRARPLHPQNRSATKKRAQPLSHERVDIPMFVQ